MALLKEFFEELEPGLNSAAESANNNAISDGYFDALSILKGNRTSFEQSYAESIQHQLKVKDRELSNPVDATPDQLSVVDKNEFEDWLTLSDVINKTNSSHDTALSNIENKLATLENQAVDEANNPVSPAVFCEVLRDQLEGFNLDHQVKQQIYKIFGISLDHQLGGLYSTLKQRLEPIASIPPASRVKSVDKTDSELSRQSSSDTAPTMSADQKRPVLVDTFKRFFELKSSANSRSLNGRLDATTAEAIAEPESISECTSKQIISALRALEPNHASDLESLETNILDRLRNNDLATATPSIDDQLYTDFAAKFCDVLNDQSADLTVADSITEKLRMPLLNLAAHEPDFINNPEHVAWQILDMIGRLNASLAESGTPNSDDIQRSVDQIIDEFGVNSSNDVAVFDSIKNKLEHIVNPLESAKVKNVERIRENCVGKHQTAKAKSYIHSIIDDRISGKSVPKIVISLLDSGWEHLLTLSTLRYGKQSKSLKNRLGILDQLLHFFCGSDDSKKPQPSELQSLLNQIDEELAIVCSDFFQHRKIIDDLSSHLIGIGQPPVRTKPEMVIADSRNTSSEDSDTDAIPEYLQLYADKVLELRVGDWLMFNLQGAERQPLNLVWIGENPWSFVFVNRKGQKSNELSLQSLATFFKHKLVWKIESLDTPLSERTFSTMLQDMHHKLIQQSTVDDHTGLINRKEFDKRLKQEFSQLNDDGSNHYLCNFEIEQIRWIDRTCGIDAAESLLKTVIDKITPTLANHDVIAQLGDQNFGVLFKLRSIEQLNKDCQNLLGAITGINFQWEEQRYKLGVSIGVIPFFKQPEGLSGLLAHADGACTAAKKGGENQILIYGEDSEELKIQESIYEWAGRISTILDQNRLFLRCQLINPLSQSPAGNPHYEILLGIKDGSGNIVSPEVFIPAAEHSGRISEIDRWVVDQIFDWIDSHPEKMEAIEGFSINLSGHSIVSKEFLEYTKQSLTNRNVNPEKITFEITETAAISNLSRAQKFISQIKRYGCKFSLDDFGSGYSSYTYLKNLDVDYLKIDGVFVKDLAVNDVDNAMVKSMNEIGHSLMIETIAEYVEDDAIIEKLREIGVDFAQGYGVEKPMLLTDL